MTKFNIRQILPPIAKMRGLHQTTFGLRTHYLRSGNHLWVVLVSLLVTSFSTRVVQFKVRDIHLWQVGRAEYPSSKPDLKA
jgi:hypothetical protein